MTGAVDELLKLVMSLARDVHQGTLRHLAHSIRESGGARDAEAIRGWPRSPLLTKPLADLAEAWRASGVSAAELAGMLLGASHSYRAIRNEESIELVWTGPSSGLVATRKTEQALLEVIEGALDALFVVSFVAYDLPTVMEALNRAITRGVEVSILLESSAAYGGGISMDVIASMRKALPAAKLYYWGTRDGEYSGGKVHAKVAVADSRVCFISSANLTGHAMERNMEAGVLIQGGTLPGLLHKHLTTMVLTGVVSLC